MLPTAVVGYIILQPIRAAGALRAFLLALQGPDLFFVVPTTCMDAACVGVQESLKTYSYTK